MVETQETLTQRFNVLEEAILNIIEEGPTDLKSQIRYWELTRKQNVLLFYSKKEGYNKLGLQPVPAPAVSEYNAKQAIQMQLLLTSLSKSQFANETWTLQDCSAELINTQPKDCFKKRGFTVEVWYDHEKEKAFPYTNWKDIYYQDAQEQWHKVEGKVDANGLYFDELNGDRVYFQYFGADSHKYGSTGEWTVHYRNATIVSSSSSNGRFGHQPKDTSEQPSTSRYSETPTQKRRREPEEVDSTTSSTATASSTSPSLRNRRRGGQQGERGTVPKRRRVESPERTSAPTASEVGSGHRLPPRQGLGRLQRLQIEARDPPILILKGSSNNLKCFRNRIKSCNWFINSSNVWRWLGHGCTKSRMLLAFESPLQRDRFIKHVKLPKDTSYAYGSLDSL
uniref:Regulatory protein E2 n=1 Tax=Human papillomavirus TaxID=10566 RepID=A0A385PI19_9PAPI|nr:MAG: E2 protein [Human papillomavirus]